MNVNMKRLLWLFVLYIILYASLFAQADDIRFINLHEGISQRTVTCITQDNKGYIWLGTLGGLNRYNGVDFVVYENVFGDSTSLSNDRITDILEDRQGRLWIATTEGLNLYDRDHDRFIRFLHDETDSTSLSFNLVYDLHEDSKANLWIGTDMGLNRWNEDKYCFERYMNDPRDSQSISSNVVTFIYEDSNMNLWCLTGDGKLNILDRDTQEFTRFQFDNGGESVFVPNVFIGMTEDNEGNLWVGTLSNGLLLVHDYNQGHIQFDLFQHEPHNQNSLNINSIKTMFLDRANTLWIGTENGGINLFNVKTRKITHLMNDPKNERSLSSNSIWSVYEDRIGRMWIGTFDKGLDVIDEKYEKFRTYRHQEGNDNSLSYNAVPEFLEDEQGNLWIATDGGGLNYLDRKTGTFTHYRHDPDDPNSLSSNAALSLYKDRAGHLWVGTYHGGINIFNHENKIIQRFNIANGSLNANHVFGIIDDRDGNILMATLSGGLNVYDPKTRRFSYFTHDESDNSTLSSDLVIQLCRDSADRIWIGTDGFGLDLLQKDESGHVTFLHHIHDSDNPESLSNNIVESIFEDSQNRLWIGTSNGLNLMNIEERSFTVFRKGNGLPNNTVHSMMEDDHGNLWIATNGGLSRMNPETGEFKNYDAGDGLQGNEFNPMGNVTKCRSGEMVFGGRHGFNLFHPDSVKDNPLIPVVYITNLKIFNKDVGIGNGSPLKKHISETDELILSHEHSVFSLEYIALNYTHAEKNQYAYMMEGFDKDWIYAGHKREATYTNLDPGKYVFRVKGSNNDGVWNEAGASVLITITPPLWQTWWFKGLAFLLIAGSVLGGYEYRFYSNNRHRKELEKQVEERTRALSAANKAKDVLIKEVHHRVKNNFAIISSLINLQSAQISDPEIRQIFLQSQTRIRSMALVHEQLHRSEDVANMDLKLYVNKLVKDLFQTLKNEKGKIDLKLNIEDIELTVDKAIPCGLIINELVSNSLKYAFPKNSGCLRVGLKRISEKTAELTVQDDGIGLPEDFNVDESDSLGLKLVRILAEEQLHGKISFNRIHGTQARIEFGI